MAGFAFSKDSRYLAYVIYPELENADGGTGAPTAAGASTDGAGPGAKGARGRKLGLVATATGQSIVLDAVASFAFAGERADWIAIHKAGAERARGARREGRRGPEARIERQRERERPGPGSDLLLRHLDSGRTLTIGHVTEYAFDESGRFLAWALHPEEKTGAGVHLRDLETDVVRILASGGGHYQALRWLERGDALAFLEGRPDAAWEEDRYALWGFSGFAAGEPLVARWDSVSDGVTVPDVSIHPKQAPYWLEDRSAIVFGLRRLHPRGAAAAGDGVNGGADEPDGTDEPDVATAPGDAPEGGTGDDVESAAETGAHDGAEPTDEAPGDAKRADRGAKSGDERLETADLVIWHWRDERLPSQQQVEESRDRERAMLVLLRVGERRLVRLGDDTLREVSLGEDDRFALGVDRRRYELDGTLDGKRFQDVWAIDPRTGERWLALEGVRWYFGPNPQGDRLLLYRDRAFWAYDLERRVLRNLTAELPASFVDAENDRNVVDPPVSPPGWSEDGRWVLLADNWDVWKVPAVDDAGPAVRLTGDGAEKKIRYRRAFRLDPEDEGLDLAEPLYFVASGERTKKGGIARLEPGKERAELLLWDDAAFATLIKAEDAPVLAYSRETAADYPDLWVAGADLRGGRRLTTAGAQREGLLWSTERKLLDYRSAKGDELQATLHLPAAYEKGRSYPAIVYIYERLSPYHHAFYAPEPAGWSVSSYTSAGYAVLMPDIRYHLDDPGMSAVWSVLPALDAAIATGVVDPERVGLHGHSFGGYQTAFIVTQTDRFKAAVAGAPLTNLVSMYSSIYWNTGSANQPIFESSQGRFTGDFLRNHDAYVRNSPVFQAASIETPLLLLHNDKDGAVDFNQGIELFNILRRLRKPVVMLEYEGENHGLAKRENRRDYFVRMREFFDHHLRGEAAPPWLVDGVRRLDLERHLEDRARSQRPAAVPGS
jgi:dienelactone hydrolase